MQNEEWIGHVRSSESFPVHYIFITSVGILWEYHSQKRRQKSLLCSRSIRDQAAYNSSRSCQSPPLILLVHLVLRQGIPDLIRLHVDPRWFDFVQRRGSPKIISLCLHTSRNSTTDWNRSTKFCERISERKFLCWISSHSLTNQDSQSVLQLEYCVTEVFQTLTWRYFTRSH